MADETKSYPSISAKHWFALRKRFITGIPKDANPNFVSLALGTTQSVARIHIITPLKQVGILDKDNRPTDRAIQWRDDAQYPNVCKSIREEIYPQELLDLAPDDSIGLTTISQWFSNVTGLGAARAKKFAEFYLLLLAADPTKQIEVLDGATIKPRTNNAPAR